MPSAQLPLPPSNLQDGGVSERCLVRSLTSGNLERGGGEWGAVLCCCRTSFLIRTFLKALGYSSFLSLPTYPLSCRYGRRRRRRREIKESRHSPSPGKKFFLPAHPACFHTSKKKEREEKKVFRATNSINALEFRKKEEKVSRHTTIASLFLLLFLLSLLSSAFGGHPIFFHDNIWELLHHPLLRV